VARNSLTFVQDLRRRFWGNTHWSARTVSKPYFDLNLSAFPIKPLLSGDLYESLILKPWFEYVHEKWRDDVVGLCCLNLQPAKSLSTISIYGCNGRNFRRAHNFTTVIKLQCLGLNLSPGIDRRSLRADGPTSPGIIKNCQ
jgi:hypothetical protein